MLARCFLCQAEVESSVRTSCFGMLLTSIPTWVNHRMESRVREIRPHGSEGGAHALPTPISRPTPDDRSEQVGLLPLLCQANCIGGADAQDRSLCTPIINARGACYHTN